MATQKRTIGKLPVFRKEYKEGVSYSRLNIVTYLGSSFISDVDNNTSVPCVVEGKTFVLSTGWSFFADTSASYLYEQTIEDLVDNQVLLRSPQELPESEQEQIRENIGAASMDDVNQEYETAMLGTITTNPASILD